MTVVHEFFTLLQREYNKNSTTSGDFGDWLVSTIDYSQNGIISEGEFKSYLNGIKFNCTETEFDQIWGRVNTETSGCIGGNDNIREKTHLNNNEIDVFEEQMKKYEELVKVLDYLKGEDNYGLPEGLLDLDCEPKVFNATVEGYVAALIDIDRLQFGQIAEKVNSVIEEAKAKATADCFIEFFSIDYVNNLSEEYKEALGDDYSPMADPIIANILNQYLSTAFNGGYTNVDLEKICTDITNLITQYFGGTVENGGWNGNINASQGTSILNSAKGNTWTAIDKAIVIDKLKTAYKDDSNYKEYKSSFDTQFKVFIDEIAGTVSAEDIKSKNNQEIKDLFWKSNAYQPLGFLISLNQGIGNSAFYIELFKALGIEDDTDLQNAIIEASKDYKDEWKEIINAIKDRLASGEFKKVYQYPNSSDSGSYWTSIDWTKLANEIKELIDAKGGMYTIDGLLEEGDMSFEKLWTKYEAEIDTIEYDKLLDPDNYKEEYINIAMALIVAIGGRIYNNKIMLEEIFNCNFDDIRTELKKMNIDEIKEAMAKVEELITNNSFINPKDYEDAEVTWTIGDSYLTTNDDAYGKLQYVDTEESVDNQKKKQAYIDAIEDFINELKEYGNSYIGFRYYDSTPDNPTDFENSGREYIYANDLLDIIKKINNIDNIDNISLNELKNIYQEIESAVSAYTSGYTIYSTYDAFDNLTSAIKNANKLPDNEVLNNVYSLKLAPKQTFKMQLNASSNDVPEDVELTYKVGNQEENWVSVVNGELVIDLTKDDAPKGKRTIEIQTLCNGVEVGEPLVIKLEVGYKKEAPKEEDFNSISIANTTATTDEGTLRTYASNALTNFITKISDKIIELGYDSEKATTLKVNATAYYKAICNALRRQCDPDGNSKGNNTQFISTTYTDENGETKPIDVAVLHDSGSSGQWGDDYNHGDGDGEFTSVGLRWNQRNRWSKASEYKIEFDAGRLKKMILSFWPS